MQDWGRGLGVRTWVERKPLCIQKSKDRPLDRWVQCENLRAETADKVGPQGKTEVAYGGQAPGTLGHGKREGQLTTQGSMVSRNQGRKGLGA